MPAPGLSGFWLGGHQPGEWWSVGGGAVGARPSALLARAWLVRAWHALPCTARASVARSSALLVRAGHALLRCGPVLRLTRVARARGMCALLAHTVTCRGHVGFTPTRGT